MLWGGGGHNKLVFIHTWKVPEIPYQILISSSYSLIQKNMNSCLTKINFYLHSKFSTSMVLKLNTRLQTFDIFIISNYFTRGVREYYITKGFQDQFCQQNICRAQKEEVSVISSDHSCKDGNARYTTLPIKSLSDQLC